MVVPPELLPELVIKPVWFTVDPERVMPAALVELLLRIKAGKNKKFKKRERKNVPFGIAHIQATFNNTIVTITDRRGNVVSWCSAGILKFSGARKSTAFVAARVAEEAAKLYTPLFKHSSQ